MADNIIILSILNPVKFRRQGYVNAAPYNTKYFEDWNFTDTIRDFEEQVGHLQAWQKNDIIYLQLLSNYSPFNIELQNCDGGVVDTFLMVYKPASTELSGVKAYEIAIALDSYAEGVYKLVIKAGSPSIIETLESEWFWIKTLHDNSVLLQYKHSENDYDVSFETGIEFRIRTLGGLGNYKPAVDRVVFIDQPRNAVQLDAKPFATEKLFIGDGYGVPNWFIERVNAIFCCSTVLIDGKQYVCNPGANVEDNREQLYPMAGWSIEVRPAKATQSKKFVTTSGEGAPNTTLIYNIESRGFGPIDGGASDNTVQIIAD
jgi:hypothetical protein